MSNKFIGITLGPIYKTMEMGTKTREVWASSYLFSYICKKVIEKLNQEGCDKSQYILPYFDSAILVKPGAGLLPDRIIIQETDSFNYAKVLDVIESVRTNFAKEIFDALNSDKNPDDSKLGFIKNRKGYKNLGITEILKDDIKTKEYLKQYFQIYTCSVDLEKVVIPGFNRLQTIITIIEQMELRYSIVDADPNPLRLFLHGINHTFLIHDCFHNDVKHFDSLPEIALRELRNINDETKKLYDVAAGNNYDSIVKAPVDSTKTEENEVIDEDELKPFEELIKRVQDKDVDRFRTYHNYVAIITADGDNVGKLLKAIEGTGKDTTNFQKDLMLFSERITNFSIETYKLIAGTRYTQNNKEDWGYGAAPVYLGGDDLVFFAPVANKVNGNKVTIFDTIKAIDNIFKSAFDKPEYRDLKDEDGNIIRPCMSYGVHISYVKYPLREAVKRSHELLKEVKEQQFKTRNRLNFEVQRHSGSVFKAILNKNETELFDEFLSIINDNSSPDDEQFISSLTQKMREQKELITSILKHKWHLDTYFKDEFNKKVHTENIDYLNKCRDYLFNIKQLPQKDNPENIELLLENFFAVLKLNHFLKSRIDD